MMDGSTEQDYKSLQMLHIPLNKHIKYGKSNNPNVVKVNPVVNLGMVCAFNFG